MPVHDVTRIDPNQYHHFHGRWYFALCDTLNEVLLPDGYYALSEQSTPPVVPDILTLQETNGDTGEGTGGIATRPKTRFRIRGQVTGPPKRDARWVVVRHATDHRVIAVVEIVSPSNKAKTKEFGRFIEKSVGLLHQGIHLV